jgi:hypothetical protein
LHPSSCSSCLCHLSKKKEKKKMIRDTIQERSNSDFYVKCATIQFYSNSYNSQFYVESPYMLSYLGVKFQVNRSLERHRNTGQQRLYEFCYLLPFDLWPTYLARILFLKGRGSFFWKSTNSKKIFEICLIFRLNSS